MPDEPERTRQVREPIRRDDWHGNFEWTRVATDIDRVASRYATADSLCLPDNLDWNRRRDAFTGPAGPSRELF